MPRPEPAAVGAEGACGRTVRWRDYTPETIRRVGVRNIFVVAEAFIYAADGARSIRIAVHVSGVLLERGLRAEDAIHSGRALLARLVDDHRDEVEAIPTDVSLLYDISGARLE